MAYYSERHGIRKQKEKTYDVSIEAYNLILEIIDRYLINLAWKFPQKCPDNNAIVCGIDLEKLYRDLRLEIPGLFNKDGFNIPRKYCNVFDGEHIDEYDQYSLLDYIEYISINMKDFVIRSHHSYFSHYHYDFVAGNKSVNAFGNEINQIFEKIGLLYKLNDNSQVERIAENETLIRTVEKQVETVSEKGLKDLLEEALSLYKDPSIAKMKDATEKLWDAFERLKTYYAELNKKASLDMVLTDAASGSSYIKELLDVEFKALTSIGNNYRIRHHETDKIEITDINHYEYFFNRCLSAISLVLKYLKQKI